MFSASLVSCQTTALPLAVFLYSSKWYWTCLNTLAGMTQVHQEADPGPLWFSRRHAWEFLEQQEDAEDDCACLASRGVKGVMLQRQSCKSSRHPVHGLLWPSGVDTRFHGAEGGGTAPPKPPPRGSWNRESAAQDSWVPLPTEKLMPGQALTVRHQSCSGAGRPRCSWQKGQLPSNIPALWQSLCSSWARCPLWARLGREPPPQSVSRASLEIQGQTTPA